jgi:hypothetical protein
MIGYILEAIAGAIITDAIVKKTTGKHIHEHVFGWWCEMRDYIAQWLHANQSLGIRRIGLVVLDWVDDCAVQTKRTADRVTVRIFACDAQQKGYEICTQELSREEVLAQFPGLSESTPVLTEELH